MKLLMSIVLVAFSVYSGWCLVVHHPIGILKALGDPWAVQFFIDVVIACSFGIAWMLGDARRRGIDARPFIVLTLLAGSIGLLAYGVRRSTGVAATT